MDANGKLVQLYQSSISQTPTSQLEAITQQACTMLKLCRAHERKVVKLIKGK
jgi:hypothetical protein